MESKFYYTILSTNLLLQEILPSAPSLLFSTLMPFLPSKRSHSFCQRTAKLWAELKLI